MKTLYLTRGNNIIVDKDTDFIDKLYSCREGIDRIHIVEEPVHVIYSCGEKRVEADAEEGDIIITFYENVFETPMVVVKNNKWYKNLADYKKKEEEAKLKWAQEQEKGLKACERCSNEASC